MTLVTENLQPRVLSSINLPILGDVLDRFRTPHATGVFVLTTTPMHRHLRLEFRGTGEMAGVLLQSSFFSEDLLLQPGSIARLIDQAVAFLVKVADYRPESAPIDLGSDEPAVASA